MKRPVQLLFSILRGPFVGLCALIVLIFLGMGVSPASAQEAPEVEFPITVSTDSGESLELSLGLDPSATAGIDSALGEEELPPLPPSDIFDARLIDDDIPPTGLGEGLVDDFRDGSASFSRTKEHEIQIQPGSGVDSVTVSWDLPAGVTGTLTDVITDGGIVDEPMTGSGSFTLTDLNITKLFVTLDYGEGGNQPPTASDDSYQTEEGQSLTVDVPGVLGNDSDPDGDSLTASVVSGVSSGTLTLDGDGSFEYTPDTSFTGTDQFTYEAADGNGGTDQATATIEVGPAGNQPPTAESDSFSTPEGQVLTVSAPGVLGNDTDPNGDSLTASVVSDVSNGTLVLDGNGSFEYTPDSGFTGTDQFTYEAADGNGAADQTLVSITVESSAAGPAVSFPITVSTDGGESQELSLGLDPSATDGIDSGLGEEELPPLPPSDIFDARLIDDDIPPTGFGEGLIDDFRDGSVGFAGTKEHEIQLQPGSGVDSVTVSWDLPAGVTGTLTDVITDGGIVDEPMTGSGSFTLTNLDVTKLFVTIEYGEGGNQPPTAEDDSFATVEGQALTVEAPGVLGNDTDPDGDSLTASVVSGTSNGTLTLNADGSFSYGPEEGFTGTDSFVYEASTGEASDTASVTIEVEPAEPSPGVTFDLAEVSVPPGETAAVDLRVEDFENVTSAQFTVTWDSTTASFGSVGNFNLRGLTGGNFGTPEDAEIGDGTLTMVWSDPQAEGVTLEDSTVVFTMELAAEGAAGSQTPLTFGDDPTAREVTVDFQEAAFNGEPGAVEVTALFSISGTVDYYPEDQAPIQDVDLQLEGPTTDSTSTGGEGTFSFEEVQPGDYTLTPSRSVSDPSEGITALDLVLIRRDILGLQPLEGPFQRLGADANESASISALDIVLFRRVILGLSSTLPGGFWRFVPSDHTFEDPEDPFGAPLSRTYTNLDQPIAGQDFTAVKRGDVNGSRTSSTVATAETKADAQAEQSSVRLDIADRTAAVGDTVRVPVRAKAFQDVAGIQFTLQWASETLSFVDAPAYGLDGLTAQNLGTNRADEGKVTMVWATPTGHPQNLPVGESLMTLRFRVEEAGQTELQFASSPTPIRAYEGGTLSTMAVQGDEGNVDVQETPQDYRFAPNYPNPAQTVTHFEYALPEATSVNIKVYDLLGRVVATLVDGRREAGRHTARMNVGQLSSGLYVVRLQAGAFSRTRKMTVAQ